MNPQTVLAEVLVDELVRLGVREVVLAPGSRSAPLAYALHAADAAGRLRMHVRVDERSAAFLALGLAKATGVPAPVVTTSGTAVANLMPAVLEAHESGVPMLLLTADRPPELRGTRANQTTDQPGFFGRAMRWFHDLGVPEARVGAQAAWRTSLDRAVAAATGTTGGDPGPVHLNLPLRDPLPPETEPSGEWPESSSGRPDGGPWTRVESRASSPSGPPLPMVARTLVVLGDASPRLLESALGWARRRGHPVIGEPFGRIDGEGNGVRLPHGVRLAARAEEPDLLPDRIVVVGRLTLSRSLARVLRLPDVRVDLVVEDHRWPDPGHVVHVVHGVGALLDPATDITIDTTTTGTGTVSEPAGAAGHPSTVATEFRDAWARAASEASTQIAAELRWPSGPALAAALLRAVPEDALVFLGSSNGVRHVDLVRGGEHVDAAEVVGSRGLAGIDGCVSTAAGLALASGRPTYAFLGDLTFLHDANGLLIGPDEPRVDLTIVVGNDDGGAIFADLEYGRPALRQAFPGVLERVFRTPTGTDVGALCAAHGVRHVEAASAEEVAAAVAEVPIGITVVEVPLTLPRRNRRL
ncbi:2-succinyl-5-enolpyruvyl-6-hydroxy-3-cyclohexene-1-carboxylic-acid synthase [Mobilicoccus caccae]|uniref:2-succinyl-5-enolpyruvyl-6-hydroxy-3-cyclohexene-1-carboxylate synthase n=1 Tax=Mobilicoccus caccae TaxID=1859295 RepID=A0ABQ6ISI2_9MICO|nr:2-succinyl-5-enolpyruvyl-6-hydroxy-3-cyclohexene-1-carboxylic-acid synthase [Mobilicoccus caccae]GMA40646.1 2-succinyl-5-enolpyruvyl-6-hydroxy-3-cyclohexene- 1-carboxylate synthase [Mobilicoccus caccae]